MKLRILALVALLFVACDSFTEGDGSDGGNDVKEIPALITAEINDVKGTRSELQGVEHHFVLGDAAHLFFNTAKPQRWVYKGSGGQKSGEFVPTEGAAVDAVYELPMAVMVYPGLNGVQHDAVVQTISYRVNSTQHYVENSYDPESTLMVGMSTDDKFSLTSLYGWYKISLPKSYVFKSLYFRGNDGEQLTGTACYSYADNSFEFVTVEGSREITLDCNNFTPTDEEGMADFYFALMPQTFSKGVTISVDYGDGVPVLLFMTHGSVTIEANCITESRDTEEWESRGIGTYADDFLSGLYSQPVGNCVPVAIEESASRPGYYRLVNLFSEDNSRIVLGGLPSDMSFASEDVYIVIDARDPENVFIPYQYVGVDIAGWNNVYIGMTTNDPGTMGVLKDGVITFPVRSLGIFNETGSGYYSNTNGRFRIMFEGHEVYMTASYRGEEVIGNEYASVFDFVLGEDVAEYRYTIVEGDADITTHDAVLELLDGNFSGNYVCGTKPVSEPVLNVTALATGLYPLFAVPVDSAGKPSELDLTKIVFYARNGASDEELAFDATVLFATVAELVDPSYEEMYPSSSCLYLYLMVDAPYNKLINHMGLISMETTQFDEYLAKDYTLEQIFAEGKSILSLNPNTMHSDGYVKYLLGNLAPNTSYTVVLRIDTSYGVTQYFSATASTKPL